MSQYLENIGENRAVSTSIGEELRKNGGWNICIQFLEYDGVKNSKELHKNIWWWWNNTESQGGVISSVWREWNHRSDHI